MSADIPEAVVSAFQAHEAYESSGEGFALTTVAFDADVTAQTRDDQVGYTVTVRAPTLAAATAEEVGDAVLDGWFDTLTRRLEAVPKATRADVELAEFSTERRDSEVHITYVFLWGNPAQAASIAKTFAEYVEGTYVEGIVPGYEYEPPVSDLLAGASHADEGGTPL